MLNWYFSKRQGLFSAWNIKFSKPICISNKMKAPGESVWQQTQSFLVWSNTSFHGQTNEDMHIQNMEDHNTGMPQGMLHQKRLD